MNKTQSMGIFMGAEEWGVGMFELSDCCRFKFMPVDTVLVAASCPQVRTVAQEGQLKHAEM